MKARPRILDEWQEADSGEYPLRSLTLEATQPVAKRLVARRVANLFALWIICLARHIRIRYASPTKLPPISKIYRNAFVSYLRISSYKD